MHRFFVEPDSLSNDCIIIEGSDFFHMKNVLRLNKGDEVSVCDKCGFDYLCKITDFSQNAAHLEILQKEKTSTEPPISVTLYQGVTKGDKLDMVVQKCVELGCVKFVPVSMKRSVKVIKDASKTKNRMEKIVYEACKQSSRGIIPKVMEVLTFKEAIDDAKENELKLLPYESERDLSIKEVLKKSKDIKNVCIFIGPEGGFSDEEITLAKDNGFEIVSMGPRILRTETAPISAITAVMYELGDW